MKKIILISMLFLISCCMAGEYTSQETIEKIKQETKACIDKNYMTDYAMMQCTIDGTGKYKNEIEKTIKSAKKMLSQSQYKQLLKTQTKWEKFMEQNDILLKQTYEKNCPPYLPCLTSAHIKHVYTRERIKDLSGFFGLLELFKEDGVLDDGINFVPFNY